MPTYRSLTLSLISQFDILTIPEYAPPSIPPDPFIDSSKIPTLVAPSTAIVSVYIPTYPCSQFWLSYSVSPPWPPGLLYYFKLFINGTCLVSWGCGEEDGYKGKTMFGLYASPGGRGLERRSLAFGPPAGDGAPMPGFLDDVMEVRVYRSKGRTRAIPEVVEYPRAKILNPKTSSKKPAAGCRRNGIRFVNAGFLHQRQPQRFYKYALLDPLDQPFSTFRYYYRTWNQLETLGVISRPPSTESSSLCSAPTEQAPSCNSSVETTRIIEHEPSSPLEDSDLADSVSTPDNDSIDEVHAPTSTVSSTAEPKSPRRYRPPTPPPSASGPTKITFMPTAVGLIPTNLDHNPLALHPPSLTAAAPFHSSSPSSLLHPSTTPPLLPPTSRESFATLVHTRLNSPNPDSFKLTDLSATIEKVSLNQQLTPPRLKRGRNGTSGGVLRTMFGHDNLRDESRLTRTGSIGSNHSRSGRSRNSDGVKGKTLVKSAHKDGGINPAREEHATLAPKDEHGRGSDVDNIMDSSNGKGKGKERIRQDSRERGRTRSKNGAGRKLNLWEEI